MGIDLGGAAGVFEKTCFSMLAPAVKELLEAREFTDAILVGIEAHVCVQQTALDLLESGKRVHLCVDAISSQTLIDRACGLRRAERAGAILTTTESVMMELIRTKDHPSFKAISGCLKTNRAVDQLSPI